MKYPIAIHHEPQACFGVTVPDVPGCFSAGDTLDAAVSNAHEAILSHLQVLAELGQKLPLDPKSIEDYRTDPEFSGATWRTVDIDRDEISRMVAA